MTENPYEPDTALAEAWDEGFTAGYEQKTQDGIQEHKRRAGKSVVSCVHGMVDPRFCTYCQDSPGGWLV
jgi:hypothetical protein